MEETTISVKGRHAGSIPHENVAYQHDKGC